MVDRTKQTIFRGKESSVVTAHKHHWNDITGKPSFDVEIPELKIPDYHEVREWKFDKVIGASPDGLFVVEAGGRGLFIEDSTGHIALGNIDGQNPNMALHVFGTGSNVLGESAENPLCKFEWLANNSWTSGGTVVRDGAANVFIGEFKGYSSAFADSNWDNDDTYAQGNLGIVCGESGAINNIFFATYYNTKTRVRGIIHAEGQLKWLHAIELLEGKELRYYDVGSSHYLGFSAPALTATQSYVWAAVDATAANQAIISDASGNLSWSQAIGTSDNVEFAQVTVSSAIVLTNGAGIGANANLPSVISLYRSDATNGNVAPLIRIGRNSSNDFEIQTVHDASGDVTYAKIETVSGGGASADGFGDIAIVVDAVEKWRFKAGGDLAATGGGNITGVGSISAGGMSLTGNLDMNANEINDVNIIDAGVGGNSLLFKTSDGEPGDLQNRLIIGGGSGSDIDIFNATLDLNSNGIVTVGSITMDEDSWIGIGAALERLVFDGTSGQIDIIGANLDLNGNNIISNSTATQYIELFRSNATDSDLAPYIVLGKSEQSYAILSPIYNASSKLTQLNIQTVSDGGSSADGFGDIAIIPDGTEKWRFLAGGNILGQGGSITGVAGITATGTVQAEHLYSTDDLVVDDDATITGTVLATSIDGSGGTVILNSATATPFRVSRTGVESYNFGITADATSDILQIVAVDTGNELIRLGSDKRVIHFGSSGFGGLLTPSHPIDVTGVGRFSTNLLVGAAIGIGTETLTYTMMVEDASGSSIKAQFLSSATDQAYFAWRDTGSSGAGKVRVGSIGDDLSMYSHGSICMRANATILTVSRGITTTGTVQAEHLYSTDDIVADGAIENAKAKITDIGGYAVKLANRTGAVTVQGQLVKADTATDDGVILTASGDTECFGVFLDAGVADDAEAWVVVSGIADVAMEDNTAATHGNWVETSDSEAGYADATGVSPAAAPAHFEEIGHCIESVAAGGGGTHILARCVLHFN